MKRTIVLAGTLGALLAASSASLACGHRRLLPAPPPGAAGPVAGLYIDNIPHSCRSGMDCSGDTECVRPQTSLARTGVCGIAIDAQGRQAGLAVKTVPQCSLGTDCPANFTCYRLSMQDGMCIR
ncbi:MAG TPA: hypothetical protein VND93_08590 [Myxococcales bacterium]|jgi:hypothetical protein|nr:hypothetical protein [Myxococcales bacterium]